MKIEGQKGDYAFKALTKWKTDVSHWGLSAGYFFSLEEVESYYSPQEFDIKFPIDEIAPGCLYIPSQEELDEDSTSDVHSS